MAGKVRQGTPASIHREEGKRRPARPAPGGKGRRDVIALKPLVISGREVLPLVEGGKGISVSNGESSGAWAAAGGVGTVSGVNPELFDEHGEKIPQIYHRRTRHEPQDGRIN